MEINYKDLGLEISNSKNTFEFNGQQIEIVKYLSYQDKYDLIMATIEKSEENLYCNDFKLEMYYHLHLVMMYTNIVFSIEDRQDEGKLYDELCASGFMDLFLNYLDKDEYTKLFKIIKKISETISESKRSAGAVIQAAIDKLPKNAEKAMEIINKIDPNEITKIQQATKEFFNKNNVR